MIHLAKNIASRLNEFRRDETGSPTVEFVIIAPFLFWFTFSTFESGWLMTQQAMLNRGLNMVTRELRLDLINSPTHLIVKNRICHQARILRNCSDSLKLELIDFVLADGPPTTAASCVDRTEDLEPDAAINRGADEQLMFMRACIVVDPLLPGFGLGAALTTDSSGGLSLVARAAYTNEPL